MNTADLIDRATRGLLSAAEAEDVARALRDGAIERYDGLLVIGRTRLVTYAPLVETYLDCPEDPMLARLALQILCRYFGLGLRYRDAIERFLRKVDWDDEDDVRTMAIGCAGTLLAQHEDRPLLSLLLATYRDEEEGRIMRRFAYEALAEAVGAAATGKTIDPQVLAAVEKRLGAKG
jgi:hypothetical protein